MTIKIKAIIGSTSSTSNNLKLIQYMKERYRDQLDIQPVFINDVDTFSIDIETTPPENVKAFKADVKDSDAVLFSVPEYNYSIPGALKNAIDWLSRGGDFTIKNKPAYIVGSSMGEHGSVRAQMHLRDILSNPALSPILLPGNEVYVGTIQDKIDENGQLTDHVTITILNNVIENFVELYHKTNNAIIISHTDTKKRGFHQMAPLFNFASILFFPIAIFYCLFIPNLFIGWRQTADGITRFRVERHFL